MQQCILSDKDGARPVRVKVASIDGLGAEPQVRTDIYADGEQRTVVGHTLLNDVTVSAALIDRDDMRSIIDDVTENKMWRDHWGRLIDVVVGNVIFSDVADEVEGSVMQMQFTMHIDSREVMR